MVTTGNRVRPSDSPTFRTRSACCSSLKSTSRRPKPTSRTDETEWIRTRTVSCSCNSPSSFSMERLGDAAASTHPSLSPGWAAAAIGEHRKEPTVGTAGSFIYLALKWNIDTWSPRTTRSFRSCCVASRVSPIRLCVSSVDGGNNWFDAIARPSCSYNSECAFFIR